MSDRSEPKVALEGVRGLLVASIVGYHCLRLVTSRNGDNWGDISSYWWWMGTARFGVDAFFVLAGYLVIGSWHSCRARARSTAVAVRDFASRRAWRILPPYLVMLVILVPLVRPELLRPGGWGDLARLLSLQGYLDVHLPATVNVPIWSLTTEVHFYLVAPILAWVVHRFGGWRTWLVAAPFAVWWIHGTWRGEYAEALLPGRIDQFLLGAAVAALMARTARGERSRLVEVLTTKGVLPALSLALLAVGTYHGATFQHPIDALWPDLVHPVAALLMAGILVRLVAGPPVRVLEHPALVWLGGISFSLYLWHYVIIDQGLRATGGYDGPMAQAVAMCVVLVAAAVAVSALSQRFVERPALRHRTRARARAPLPVVQPELALQDLQEVALAAGDEAGGVCRGGADDRVALAQLP
jgi:peptidoglycan/LPS O-acetylase OafA/YrhL